MDGKERPAPLLEFVIPCYNEAGILPELIDKCIEVESTSAIKFILVENGSTDDSRAILGKFADRGLQVVYVPQNLGYGYGVHQGLLATDESTKYVGWAHGDLQIDLSILPALIAELNPQANIFVKGRRKGRGIRARIFTGLMSLYMSLLFRRCLRDVNGQPTIFSRSLLAKANQPPPDFSYDLYIFLLALRNGYFVTRSAVQLGERKKGRSSWNTGITAMLRLSLQMIKSGRQIRRDFLHPNS